MKPKSKALTIGGAWLLSNVVLFTAFYRDSREVKEQNDNARKQVVFPLVERNNPFSTIEEIIVSPIENDEKCPRTDYSEPVNVFLGKKLIGCYCLARSIDEKATRWIEDPRYKFYPAKSY